MSESEFIGGDTGGIPERIFHPGFHETITTASGKEMNCDVTTTKIDISSDILLSSLEDSFVRFKAELSEDNLLHLTINSKGMRNGNRHPDIYAKKLLMRTLRYFESLGRTIDGIQALWTGLQYQRDNFDQYYAYLSRFQNQQITEEMKIEAAKSTWTGRVTTSLGFTEIRVNDRNSGEISTTFRRPSPKKLAT